LAPEHPFPAAVDDSLRVQWVQSNASDLSVGPIVLRSPVIRGRQILRPVVCLLAARSKIRPKIAYQLLIYPDTRVNSTPAERPFGSGYFLDNRTIEQYHVTTSGPFRSR